MSKKMKLDLKGLKVESFVTSLKDEEKAKAIGIREYIMKPIVIKELAEVISKALGKKEAVHCVS